MKASRLIQLLQASPDAEVVIFYGSNRRLPVGTAGKCTMFYDDEYYEPEFGDSEKQLVEVFEIRPKVVR